ncbi:MAG: cysteine--tRNA ligase [Paenalcaligenes sp.]
MSLNPSIQLYNTLLRRKAPLQTEQPDRVTMYVCGPTVYNFAHIGNARPAVVFDVLARLLRHDYPHVIYARNFTDVDDKINAAAAEQGVPIEVITNRYIAAYHEDMQALGVLSPNVEPRVTDHIPAIVDLISTLIERGHAYVAQDHVLFHVPSYPAYGQLSGRRTEDMLVGARIEVAPYKQDPMDFVLWKPSIPEQPGWESPWGRGRPGWHVECTAMIAQHLGHTIDIHGGGQDLIFPHHENEIAQGTCAHGEQYCRTWVHNSFVTVDGLKMSKSLGNVLLVRDLLAQGTGEAIRLALLSTHYRRPLDWTNQRLEAAKQTLMRFYSSLLKAKNVIGVCHAEPDPDFLTMLRNDLNVPAALTRLHMLRTQLDEAHTESERAHAKSRLLASGKLLGLLQALPARALEALAPIAPADDKAQLERAYTLLNEREQARERRDFTQADQLRDTLKTLGYHVEDGPTGPTLQPILVESCS